MIYPPGKITFPLLKSQKLVPLLGLLLLCSCATTPDSPSMTSAGKVPANVKMNEDAGRGNWLFVTLRLANGQELLFKLDTVATITC